MENPRRRRSMADVKCTPTSSYLADQGRSHRKRCGSGVFPTSATFSTFFTQIRSAKKTRAGSAHRPPQSACVLLFY